MADTIYQCAECEWKGTMQELAPIANIEERVWPGELHAAGQCPACGALCGVDDNDVPDSTLEAVAHIMRQRGWRVEKLDT